MRKLFAIAMMSGSILLPTQAHAFEYKALLIQIFGTSKPSELGGPIFAAIAVIAVLLFWIALKLGRRRQRRMISDYDAQLQDYSKRLRRDGV